MRGELANLVTDLVDGLDGKERIDIEIDGVTVPKGSPLVLALASANRDPERFDDADKFVPDRADTSTWVWVAESTVASAHRSPASKGRWR